MNEFSYLKLFFKEFYVNRIRPIWFFIDGIFERVMILFMTKEQKCRYIERKRKRINDEFMNTCMSLIPLSVGVATTSVVSSILKNMNKNGSQFDKNVNQKGVNKK